MSGAVVKITVLKKHPHTRTQSDHYMPKRCASSCARKEAGTKACPKEDAAVLPGAKHVKAEPKIDVSTSDEASASASLVLLAEDAADLAGAKHVNAELKMDAGTSDETSSWERQNFQQFWNEVMDLVDFEEQRDTLQDAQRISQEAEAATSAAEEARARWRTQMLDCVPDLRKREADAQRISLEAEAATSTCTPPTASPQ